MNAPDDPTAEESRALRGWLADAEPPGGLERLTVARLRSRGLLGTPKPRRRLWKIAAAVAAGAALFGLGLLLGLTRADRGPAPDTRQFVLLLYGADEAPRTAEETRARVDEYRAWARELRRRGTSIHGEKLESDGRWLGAPAEERGRPLGGYFVIGASDLDAAAALARSCPHLKHGGRIEVRPIART